MTERNRAFIRSEVRAAIALLSTIDVVYEHVLDDPDAESLRAVRVLYQRQLDRIDRLLLDDAQDVIDDERLGRNEEDR